MISDYFGNYSYNKETISMAPDKLGVYYCGHVKNDGHLGTLYVGRAAGEGVTIKSRLLNHIGYENWTDVTHFGFYVCSTKQEAIDLEAKEIKRLQPKYNNVGK